MKRKGQGPTVHQSAVAETVRHNPVASIDQKVVVDAPAWYAPVEPFIEHPFAAELQKTTSEVLFVSVANPTPLLPLVETVTGLPVLDAPFHYEVASVGVSPEVTPETAATPADVAFVPSSVQADGSISGSVEPVTASLSDEPTVTLADEPTA